MAEKPHDFSECPLHSDKYFASPLATLLESINDPQSEYITLHDLTEAYAVLSRRIRLQASTILTNVGDYPALVPIRTNNSSLTLCLIRDVGRCLLSPSSIFSQQGSANDDDESTFEEEIERAQAYATLSHHALILLSDAFSLMPIMHIFTAKHLEALLREVLLILSNRALPTPNAEKTRKLAILVLLSQRLPSDILLSRKQELASVITSMIQREFEDRSYRAEGLKLLAMLLSNQPSEFTNVLLSLYSPLSSFLTQGPLDVRVQALGVLSCAMRLKLDSPDARWSKKIAAQTHSFVRTQAGKHKISQEERLQQILLSAINGTDGFWGHKGPLWALLLTGCLICLSDADVFAHPHSLKLFLSILAQATNHKSTHIRALHPHIWNCLVWCYSRLSLSTPDTRDLQKLADVRKRAFLVLRQELKGGIATALTASVLKVQPEPMSSPTSEGVSSALEVISDLLSSSKESRVQEAGRIMHRLVSGVNAPSGCVRIEAQDLSNIVIRNLFSGSLLDSQEAQIKSFCSRLPRPDERLIQPLTESQILEHWDKFVQLWVQGVNCTLGSNIDSVQHLDRLLNVWQTLLLVRSHLIPRSTTLTMLPQTSKRVTSIVTRFLTMTDDTTNQLLQLKLMQGLWSVLKQSYETQWLASLAEAVLSVVLKRKYAFHEEGVRSAWGKLCADLASIGLPNFLHTVFAHNDSRETEVQRQFWVTLANSKQIASSDCDLEEVLSFLAIPLRSWALDLQELETWTHLFNKVLKLANNSSIPPGKVVHSLLQKLGESITKMLASSPAIIPVLLPHTMFDSSDVLDVRFLRDVGARLAALYPPAPEDHMLAIPILDCIAHLVASASETNIIQLLSALTDGLCPWIKDDSRILLEHEHSALIHNIYCSALAILAKVPPSAAILQELSSFLASAFERIGHPPTGPLTFEQFWRATYHQHDSFNRFIQDDLRTCLKAWSDHCGDSLGEGISSITDSQTTHETVIQDSQLPDKAAAVAANEASSPCMDSDDIYDMIAPFSPASLESLERSPITSTPRATTPKATPRRLLQPSNASSYPQIPERSIGSDVAVMVHRTAGSKRQNSQGSQPNPKRRRIVDSVNTDRGSDVPTTSNISRASNLIPREPTPGLGLFPLPQGTGLPRTPEHRTRRRAVPFAPQLEKVVPEIFPPAALPVPGPSKVNARVNEIAMSERSGESFDACMEMDALSPSTHEGDHHSRPSPAKRLQSEPVLESRFTNRPTPLRRNHTTTERLGALERAYTLVAQVEGVSQVPVEELAHAARIAHEIGAKLNEQITTKLRKGSYDHPKF